MVNYQNAKIYKLVSNSTDKVYIGSTCQSLTKRKAKHKDDYKRYLQGKCRYITSFQLVELGDIDIVLLENYSCNSQEELHKKERFYIEGNNCVNKCIPTRTYKEYNDANKEKAKEYRLKNLEKIKKQKGELFTCSCGKRIAFGGKARHNRSLKHIQKTNNIN